MFRPLFAISLCAVLSLRSAADDITYTVGPFVQGPVEITGTIITDGKLGVLSDSDIVYWDVGNTGLEAYASRDVNNLIATASTLSFPASGGSLGFADYDPPIPNFDPPPEAQIHFDTFSLPQNYGLSISEAGYNANSYGWTFDASTTLPTQPYVIATSNTPEPSGLALGALAAICLAASYWRRSSR